MNVIVIDFQNKIFKTKFIKNIVSTNLKHNLNKILSNLDEILYRKHNTLFVVIGLLLLSKAKVVIYTCTLYINININIRDKYYKF